MGRSGAGNVERRRIPCGLRTGRYRRECLAKGRKEIPALVFCSQRGGPWQERNFNRVWERVRRKAQAEGVRPLRLHCTRHTYASRALAAGKSLRWVTGQLGHSNPELTLRQYAHMLPQEETDLSFADFGGPKRLHTAPAVSDTAPNKKHPRPKGPRASGKHGARDRVRTGDPQLGKLRHSVQLRTHLYRNQYVASARVRPYPHVLWSNYGQMKRALPLKDHSSHSEETYISAVVNGISPLGSATTANPNGVPIARLRAHPSAPVIPSLLGRDAKTRLILPIRSGSAGARSAGPIPASGSRLGNGGRRRRFGGREQPGLRWRRNPGVPCRVIPTGTSPQNPACISYPQPLADALLRE